jgi:hypothetical protein
MFVRKTFYKLLTGQTRFPITVVARYKTSTLPSHSNTGIMYSNSLGIFPFVMVCLLFFCKPGNSSAGESHKSPQRSLAVKPTFTLSRVRNLNIHSLCPECFGLMKFIFLFN